ncbi:MAG: glycoside hydrolase family 3 C-terminal domain-containing protein [Bacteroidales bacterium]|nr:glycoside hydrolase family 3 C-terminal domain-containing protein [Bacteroidales bacterium]
MKRNLIIAGAALLAMASCGGQKWQETETGYGINIITQKGGKTLGYSPASGVQILSDKGYAFKDLNRNGSLDKYEDWRLPVAVRAQDLAEQLSIEEIAGLMLYSAHQSIPAGGFSARGFGGNTYGGKSFAESGAKASDLSDAQIKFLQEDNLRHVLVTRVESPAVAAEWNNNVQAFVEGLGHGIPANNSSDPRNSASATAEYDAGSGGQISLWPSSLGMAATFEPELVEKFGHIAAQEYRALGIATCLSPQIDLATEPRWSRFSGTFGESPELDTEMARAYIDGFQTSYGADEIEGGWGYKSVNAMMKHWPSGGPEEAGRDAHYNYGKYAVYPGANYGDHIKAFVDGGLNLAKGTKMVAAVMPYYTISTSFNDHRQTAGNSYSSYLINELLRGEYSFDGVVCTDWGVTSDNPAIESFGTTCWGKETETVAQRHFDIIEAGVDQFGGNNDKGPVIEAYNMWVEKYGKESADKRFQESARRLLTNIFRTGLFENPYLDPSESSDFVGNPEFMAEGYNAQLKSIVMIKNHEKALPLKEQTKIYLPKKIDSKILDRFSDYIFVDDAKDADAALVFISEPSTGPGYDVNDRNKGGNGYVPISLQYSEYKAEYAREVSLAGGDPKESFTNRTYKGKTTKASNYSELELIINTKKAMGDKPVIAVVSMGRPMVMAEVEPYVDAIVVAFSVQNQAVLDVVTGAYEPSGLLPMQLPRDMKTVELQKEDVPFDMDCYVDSDGNTYDFAYGLNWSGIIKDARVEKYSNK